jgi:hypothetical protein
MKSRTFVVVVLLSYQLLLVQSQTREIDPSSETAGNGDLTADCQSRSDRLTQSALQCMQNESKNVTLTIYDMPDSLDSAPEAMKIPFAKCFCNTGNWNGLQSLIAPCQLAPSDISDVQNTFQVTCAFLKVPFDVKTGPKSAAAKSVYRGPFIFSFALALMVFLIQ